MNEDDRERVPNLFYQDLMEEFLHHPEPGEAWYEFVRETIAEKLLDIRPKTDA